MCIRDSLLVVVTFDVRKSDRTTAGKRHVTLTIKQALAGDVYGDERSRAGSLNVDAWTFEVQFERDRGGNKLAVIADVDLVTADTIDQLRVRRQIHIEITARTHAGVNSDATFSSLRVVSGMFERFNRALEHHAMLRIE